LYHGGGILDSGLHEGLHTSGVKAGLKLAVERDHEYLDVSIRNNDFWLPGAWAVNSPTELTLNSAIQALKLDVLTMGIPCTGASKAGKTKNKSSRQN